MKSLILMSFLVNDQLEYISANLGRFLYEILERRVTYQDRKTSIPQNIVHLVGYNKSSKVLLRLLMQHIRLKLKSDSTLEESNIFMGFGYVGYRSIWLR